MIRLMVQGMTSLALLFCAALGAIVAQPRDEAALRAFFAAPGCRAPCFFGIRPGVTTAQQAVALLQTHPWVKAIRDAGREPPSHPQDYTNIVWDWNGQQPAFLGDASADNPPYLHISNGVVQYIRLVTRIPYGEAWLTIGAPNTGQLIVGGSDSAMHSVSYLGGMLVFDSEVTCPLNPALVWNAPIAITYSDGSLTAYSKPDFHIDRAFYRSSCPS